MEDRLKERKKHLAEKKRMLGTVVSYLLFYYISKS